MSESKKGFKAAVIGLGFIGAGDQVSGDAIGQNVNNLDGNHSQALAVHPQIRLVAGSSRDPGRRERFEKRYTVDKSYFDWREMLVKEKPDIVSIATNSPSHGEIAIACAEAGVRAILCEKPMTTRLSDADAVLRSCKAHGSILAVNHNRRWHPLWRSMQAEIRSGALGEVSHAAVHWSSGRLGNVGTHFFDALHMLLDDRATEVSGVLDPELGRDCRGSEFSDPGGWGVVSYAKGAKAFIHAPQNAKLPLGVRIAGSLGQMTLRGDEALVELWTGETRVIVGTQDGYNSLERGVQDVVECLVHSKMPMSSAEDGIAALEVIIGFHVSNRLQGQRVKLPIRGEDRHLEVLIG